MPLDQFLNITYKSASYNNLAAYLDVMGVAEPIKSKALEMSSTITLKKSGDAYIVHHGNPIKDHSITFTPGEEYDDVGLDGRHHRCISTINGNKVITKILNDPKSIINSEFGPDKLTLSMESGNVQAQHIFQKV